VNIVQAIENSLAQRMRLDSTLSRRAIQLALIVLVPLVILFIAAPPIAQDARYHAFADTRSFFGIPNFWNVASNVPFLLIGIAGLRLCRRPGTQGSRRSWSAFFAGTALVGFGSGYYHWMPVHTSLAWDRLPMTIAFMALLSALVSEHTEEKFERRMLPTAVGVGIASVMWWRYTGDLRFYAWVQFAPLLTIAYVMVRFPARYTERRYLVYGLLCYALAKVAEAADAQVFSATSSVLSGHSLKHLLAALAPFSVYMMLARRTRCRIDGLHGA
jgi:hypothetical protein